ncbi:MAG: hypothetical protein DCC55_08240 [Chloroflexi bacterium]|nr:MAG: hypothetical protein DCC55_08240 [Chloroflexota bacterium]
MRCGQMLSLLPTGDISPSLFYSRSRDTQSCCNDFSSFVDANICARIWLYPTNSRQRTTPEDTMNSIMTEYWPTFEMYQSLRTQLMEILTDEELRFSPGGANPTLGALCKEIGEIEHAYIESFKHFTMDFSYRNPEAALEQSVARLTAWFAELDQELKATIAGLSEEEVQNKVVVRGPNFQLPLQIQLAVYQEALLIFYGKATVYLKALNKEPSQQWREWIG